MSDRRAAQAHHLEDIATTFRTFKGQGYTHLNAVGVTHDRIEALEAGAAALRAPSPVAWEPIETAPKDGTPIAVLTKGGAVLKAEVSDVVLEDGWAWIASNEGEHPPCWDDGVCWSENSNYQQSDQPEFWMPLPQPPVAPTDDDQARLAPPERVSESDQRSVDRER